VLESVRADVDTQSDLPTERHAEEALYGMVANLRPHSEAEQLTAIAAVCVKRLVILQEQG
jgi:hypothetical protein